MEKLNKDFFEQNAIEIAPKLLGKNIVVNNDGIIKKYAITEVEIYSGEEDTACHASKGKTERTKIMYESGGHIYVYLIYGMYWMLNIVTGKADYPEAILVRAMAGFNGPGKVGKELSIDKTFYGEDLSTSNRIWIEDNDNSTTNYYTEKRIGINYATEKWKNINWRYIIKKG